MRFSWLAPIGEVALAAPITRDLSVLAQQHQHVSFQPAVAAIAMPPAGLQVGGGALAGTEGVHGEVERRQVLGVDVLRGLGAQDLFGRIAEGGAHRITAEGEATVRIVFPDPVLRGDHDVTQLLFEAQAGAPGFGLVERAARRRRQPRHVGLEHIVVGAALQGLDGAFLAQRARQEDERRVRRDFQHHLERGLTVETGQREIGEDEIGPGVDQRAPQHGLGIHPLPRAGESPGFEVPHGDFRLGRHVFDDNHSYRLHCSCPLD